LQAQESGPSEVNDFIGETLGLDIQTAGYYELLAWCNRLGLSEKGSRDDLEQRLFNYYEIQAAVRGEQAASSTATTITITSAENTEYFTIEQIDEDYVKLEGDVVLEMNDPEKDTIHKIRADKILFNESQDLITAVGNITYTLIERGKEETFRGESLSFNVESLEGFFFSGVSEKQRIVEGETLTFRYSGDEFYRSAEEIVTLNEGIITSSKPEDPYYHIKAKKIWVLAPGEWGLRDAVLYVGRVPMLYIPFFFYVDNDLFFHPSFGYRNIEGNFFQTTTYIFGRKQDREGSLSFLQSESEEAEEYKYEIRDFFIRPVRPMTPKEKQEYLFIERTSSFIKIMLDMYTRLGVFTGLEADISEIGVVDNYSLYLAVARSRNIYFDSTGGEYLPYWYDDEEIVESDWHTSNFLGNDMPVRFGFESHLDLRSEILTFNTDLDLYSDPYFLRDFDRRSEDIDWGTILGIDDEAAEENTEQDTTGTGGGGSGVGETNQQTNDLFTIKETLQWNIGGSFTPVMTPLQPIIRNARIRNFDVNMYWKSKDTDIDGITGLDSDLPGYVPVQSRTPFSFPSQKFYYPDSYLLPEVGAELSGTIFDVVYDKKVTPDGERQTAEDEDEKTAASPPWDKNQDVPQREKSTGEEEEPEYRLGEIRNDLPLRDRSVRKPFQHSLLYKILPEVNVSSRMNSSLWNTPYDIDFSEEYSIFKTNGSSSLQYSAKLFDDYFIFSNEFIFSGTYQEHFNRAENVLSETWAEYQQQDYNSTLYTLTNNLTLSSFPLSSVDYFNQSSITYKLNMKLLEKKFDYIDDNDQPVYEDSTFEWDEEYVSQHSLGARVVFIPFTQQQILDVNTILPPLDQEINGTLTLNTGPFTTIAQGKLKKEPRDPDNEDSPEEWNLKPLSLTERFQINPESTSILLEQLFTYDFDLAKWVKSRSTANFSFFNNNIEIKESFIFGDPAIQTPDNTTEEVLPLFEDPYSNTSSLRLWFFYSNFTMKKTYPSTFEPGIGWQQEDNKKFIPETLTFGIDTNPQNNPVWKNRISFLLDIDTSVTMNLIKFSDSLFTFRVGLELSIYRFLDLNFSFEAENNNIYRYFDAYTAITGEETRDPFVDLGKSFNLFNMSDREESFFNAQRITLNLVHHMHDWDLTVEFSAEPVLQTGDDGVQQYEWNRTFSIFVQWNPIPELRSRVRYDNDVLDF
jgi:hypothetical protein